MKRYLSTRYNDGSWGFGLLLLRFTAGGLMMMLHGYDKLTHFAATVAETKKNGALFEPTTDVVLLIFAEFFCSILLLLGLFTRFACIPLIIAMSVAFFKVHNGEIGQGQLALMYLGMFLTLLFTGPGKFSVDKMIAK